MLITDVDYTSRAAGGWLGWWNLVYVYSAPIKVLKGDRFLAWLDNWAADLKCLFAS